MEIVCRCICSWVCETIDYAEEERVEYEVFRIALDQTDQLRCVDDVNISYGECEWRRLARCNAGYVRLAKVLLRASLTTRS